MYHVELRQRPDFARAFNLDEAALFTDFIGPMQAGVVFTYADKEWDPAESTLRILEGRELRPNELMMGRGWSNAQRHAEDVTAEVLATKRHPERHGATDRLKERVVGALVGGPLAAGQVVALAEDLIPGARASERLAVAEQAVWEMLHQGGLILVDPLGDPIDSAEWELVVLRFSTWASQEPDVLLQRP